MTRRRHGARSLATTLLITLACTVTARDISEPSHLAAKNDVLRRLEPLGLGFKTGTELEPEKRDVGTKDAPVDGMDGKPHAGPFVDTADSTQKSSGLTIEKVSNGDEPRLRSKEKALGDDGVMNDPNRSPPKKGTTGTEGGVSEKDRDRRIHEFSTGERMAKIPDSPKSSLVEQGIITSTETTSTKPSSDRRGGDVKEKEFLKIEEHADPPLKHDIPLPVHADDNTGSSPSKYATDSEPKHVSSTHQDHDDEDDDDDDDDDDKDGKHDIIPWDSLVGSFSSIAATEIGDKTFIVAALMAMRHSRLQVFSAAFSALFVMTILSGIAGHAMGAIISKKWAALVAALLFLVFGAKALREGMEMSPDQGVNDEIREVEAELEEKEVAMAHQANNHRRASSISPYALEAGRAAGRTPRSRSRLTPRRSPSSSRSPSPTKPTIKSAISGIKNLLSLLLSPAWVETFSMTFVGELGDRSQIATVAMAAGQEYYWVMVGASMGHFVCTGVAVLGGSVLAGRVSLRKVTLTGGGIFIGFGIFTFIEAAQYWS